MKQIFAIVLVACCCLLPAGVTARAATHPNVVIFLADDQGWGDLSLHGNGNLRTPHIDSLARDGAQFKHFFVQPVCSPTRAEFLTGRWHPRGGVWNVSTGGERLNLNEKTIGNYFQAAGYRTGAFGKWHNGTQWPYHPNARGFDEYYGFTSGHWGTYFDAPMDHNGALVRGKGFMVDDLTERAIQFIEKNKARPFFCYVPLNTPHSPMQVPDRFYGKFDQASLQFRARNPRQEDLEHTRAALAMVENIDWNVGRILEKLDQLNLSRDTIVVYFSDNGPNGWRWNGEMKGRKGTTDEGGVRSPLLIRWPGKIRPGTVVEPIAGAIDLLPTLAELCSVPLQAEAKRPLDGLSFHPLLLGQKAEWVDRTLFNHWNGKVSARTQRYRLDPAGKLFDMIDDPRQDHDLAAAKPEIAARLIRSVEEWKTEVGVGAKDQRPFTVGFPEMPLTQLPARDGVPHGEVKRSAPAPNCSFFENWTSTEDRITWEVEVATPGTYEAVVFYTCPPGQTGSKIQLSLNGQTVQAKVAEPHDPPLTGAENDRTPRQGESYVKEFKPLPLGKIELAKGRGTLTLQALEIPGDEVMDVRMVTLKLIE